MSNWKTIGLSVPKDFKLGGKELFREIKEEFDVMWSFLNADGKAAIKKRPLFAAVKEVLK